MKIEHSELAKKDYKEGVKYNNASSEESFYQQLTSSCGMKNRAQGSGKLISNPSSSTAIPNVPQFPSIK